jgi:ATP-binding cassette subfamily C protein
MKTPLVYKQFRQVLSVYNKRDKEKLFLVAISQVFLAFLDLLGVALLGIIGALSVYGIQSKSPGNRVNQILELTNLSQYDFQQQVAILGGIAAFVLIFKTKFIFFHQIICNKIFYEKNKSCFGLNCLFEFY